VDLLHLLRLVSAKDIIAPFDMPALDNAAMDGYAIRMEDLQGSNGLRVSGLMLNVLRRRRGCGKVGKRFLLSCFSIACFGWLYVQLAGVPVRSTESCTTQERRRRKGAIFADTEHVVFSVGRSLAAAE